MGLLSLWCRLRVRGLGVEMVIIGGHSSQRKAVDVEVV